MTNLIRFRRGTEGEWASANTVLASGEPGYEKGTGRVKIGDGVTAWLALPYLDELADAISPAEKGAANGVATLGGDGKIPDSQIAAIIARTADISTAVANLVDSSPGALNTLNELAAALGDDPNFATTITNTMAGKATQAALDAEVTARTNADATKASQAALDALTTTVGTKAAQTALDAEATARASADAAEATARATADGLLIPLTQKGAANGVATLGADSKVPAGQLPAMSVDSLDLHTTISGGYSSGAAAAAAAGWVTGPEISVHDGASVATQTLNGGYYVQTGAGYVRWTHTWGVNGGDFLITGWSGSGASYEYRIDGGAWTAMGTLSGGGGWLAFTTWLPVPAGAHTIDVRGVGGTDRLVRYFNWREPSAPYAYTPGVVHANVLTANETIILTANPTGAGKRRFAFKQDATGGRTITWPASVVWAGGAPTPTKLPNSYEVYELTTSDGGVTWVGVWLQDQKGVANGVATLDATGKVPAGQLPAMGLSTLAHGNTGADETFDPDDALVHTATLNAAPVAITFGAPAGSVAEMELLLTQDGTGGRLVNWPASVRWELNTIPTLTPYAARTDHFRFVTTDGGTTWWGKHVARGLVAPPATPTFRSRTSAYYAGNHTSMTLNKPTGLAVGDLMVATFTWADSSSTPVDAKAGWTRLVYGVWHTVGNTGTRVNVFWRIADAADVAAANFVWTRSSTYHEGAQLFAFYGVDPTTPFDQIALSELPYNVASGVVPSLDPVTTKGLDAILTAVPGSDQIWGTPAGFTQVFDDAGNNGQAFFIRALPNGDPTGATTLTAGSNWPQATALRFVLNGGTPTVDPQAPILEAARGTAGGVATLVPTDAVVTPSQVRKLINAQTGTAYTAVLADAEKVVTMDNAATNVFTVPTNAVAAFPIGTQIKVRQIGAGMTSIAASGGVTLQPGPVNLAQWREATLTKTATDTWHVLDVGSAATASQTAFPQVTKTGSHTLILADAGFMLDMNVGAQHDLTVPPNSAVAFPIGTIIYGRQASTGAVNIKAGTGVSLRQREGKFKTAGQWAEFSLMKRGTDEWVVAGDLTEGDITFTSTGAAQSYTIPAGVEAINVEVAGASGASSGGAGGGGAVITGQIAVTPGEVLDLIVGNNTGYGGGGAGGTNGGGRSEIKRGATSLIIAGGGGGGGQVAAVGGSGGTTGTAGGAGGHGGNPWGGSMPVSGAGGGGGTGAAGGAGGAGGQSGAGTAGAGAAGASGTGGAGGTALGGWPVGGGGGGGYFGGGGGGGGSYYSFYASGAYSSAGGGGSSYIDAAVTGSSVTPGGRTGNGYVAISLVQ